jgi:hypothetical protein
VTGNVFHPKVKLFWGKTVYVDERRKRRTLETLKGVKKMKNYFVLIIAVTVLLLTTSGCPNAESDKFCSLFEEEYSLKECYFSDYWVPSF